MAKEAKTKKVVVKSLEDFHAKFGNQRVDVLDRSRNARVWSTGSLNIDELANGGIPQGRMVELYGPPGGGKSTVALKTASLVLAQGKRVAYFDLERGLDLRNAEISAEGAFVGLEDRKETAKQKAKREASRASWLRTNGINPLDENLEIYEPYTGEDLFTMLAAAVSNGLFALMIVDSVPAILPSKVLEGDPGDGNFGARAKLLAEELPRLLRLYENNSESTIIFINQVRENIGAQIKSQKSTGGYALEHYVRFKAKCQRIRRVVQGADLITESRFKIEKNIYGRPGETLLRISALRGVDTLSELLDVAREKGYVMQSGNWHYFFEEPMDEEVFAKAHKKKASGDLPGYIIGLNGEAAALDWMQANGWEAKMFAIAKDSTN